MWKKLVKEMAVREKIHVVSYSGLLYPCSLENYFADMVTRWLGLTVITPTHTHTPTQPLSPLLEAVLLSEARILIPSQTMAR